MTRVREAEPSATGEDEPHLPYSRGERATLRLRFERVRRRHVPGTVLFVLLTLVPFELFVASIGSILLLCGALLAGYVLFAGINWRCPGCRHFLGFRYTVRVCPGCRLQFR